jgi:hypothetical protein
MIAQILTCNDDTKQGVMNIYQKKFFFQTLKDVLTLYLLLMTVSSLFRSFGMEDLIDLSDPVQVLQPGQHDAQHAAGHTPSQPPTQMDTDSTVPDLGNVYKQCKLAKETGINVSHTVFNSGTEVSSAMAKPARIGNLDMAGDTEVLSTFHGARICKGSKIVNDCVSISFDPRNLMCVGCQISHKIGDKGPITVCFSDQNFVPFILDREGGCIAIVRLDNASLSELVDLSFEIFEKNPLPAGSVVLYGSGSYLFRAGVSVYARESVRTAQVAWPGTLSSLPRGLSGSMLTTLRD